MSGEIIRVFGWGIVVGVALGVGLYRTVRSALHRWFPKRMQNQQEQEIQRLRSEVSRLQKAIEEKDHHIRMAMEAAMKEMPRS